MKFGMKFTSGKNKDYRLTLQRRKKLFMGMIAVGLVISGLSFFFLDPANHASSYTKGFGVGLIVIAVILSFKNKQMLANEEKMKKNMLEEFDERNIAIDNRALITALRVFIALLAFFTVVTAFIKPDYSVLLGAIISLYLLLYLAFYFYYQRKM